MASSALQRAARDSLGLGDAPGLGHLHRVVDLSGFPIRKDARFSHPGTARALVRSRLLGRLWADFSARYGFAQWLIETVVSPPFDGASLRASKCQWLGETRSVPADTITLNPADGLAGLSWAEAELGGAAFNDARLSVRLVTIAQLKGAGR